MWNQRVIQFVIVGAIVCWLSAAERKSVSAAPTSKVAATADQVHLPPHFFVEKVYQVPRKTYGSWVALTVDPKGRLIVSAESGGLYRVTLPEKGSRDKLEIEKIDVPLGQAQGLLCAFDSLYVIVNGRAAQGPGLYQVSDSNGDDRYDQVALLKKLNGIGEHGPHGVVLGPDGKSLYIIAGNATEMPQCGRSLAPKLWANDSILATQNDSRGFGAHLRPPGGWICRTDPTGTQWNWWRPAFATHTI